MTAASKGSSPALRIACPKCGAAEGDYCKKFDGMVPGGSVQLIAHKRRREAEMASRPCVSAIDCRCAGSLYHPDKPCPVHPKVLR